MNKKSKNSFLSEDYYNQLYTNKPFAQGMIKQSEYILSKINNWIKENQHILDIGCGSGEFGFLLQKQKKAYVSGLELSQAAVREAKRKGINAKYGDLMKIWPFEDNSMDVITSIQVIEHVINPDMVFTESYRVLKPGGFYITTTPNLAVWFNRIIFLLGYQPFFTEVSTKDKTIGLSFTRNLTPYRESLGHLKVFTLKGLVELYSYYGFNVVKSLGGRLVYLPPYMKPIDTMFSFFPGFSGDLIVIGQKPYKKI